MLLEGIEKYGVDIENSFMIGDKKGDLEAGKKAGLKSILVLTGYGKKVEEEIRGKYAVAKDLLDVVNILKK